MSGGCNDAALEEGGNELVFAPYIDPALERRDEVLEKYEWPLAIVARREPMKWQFGLKTLLGLTTGLSMLLGAIAYSVEYRDTPSGQVVGVALILFLLTASGCLFGTGVMVTTDCAYQAMTILISTMTSPAKPSGNEVEG